MCRSCNYKINDLSYIFSRKSLITFIYITCSFPVSLNLSVLYFVRTQDLEVGKSVFVDNFTDGEKYALEVKVIGKEEVTVPAGTFECVVVEPLLQSVGVFRHEGKLKVWLTDDRLKMPVLMKSKVLVGSISAELSDFQLGDIETF